MHADATAYNKHVFVTVQVRPIFPNFCRTKKRQADYNSEPYFFLDISAGQLAIYKFDGAPHALEITFYIYAWKNI